MLNKVNGCFAKTAPWNAGEKNAVGGKERFMKVMDQACQELQTLDAEAGNALSELATGNARDLHTAVLAVEKQSLALDLVISVRNKAIEAYQEIMRMPV